MSVKIVSETSKQYLLTEDAVEGLRIAVANGQTRLALQVLMDVIDGIMEVFDYAMEETSEEVAEQVTEVPAVVEVVEVVEKVEEKKATTKKATDTKEEVKHTAE